MSMRLATYTYNDAIQCLDPNRNLNDKSVAYAVNKAGSHLWNVADWTVTLGKLNPFYLYPDQQWYGRPATVIPNDFHGIREAYCVNLQSDTVNRWPLDVVQNIQVTHLRDWPSSICYDPTRLAFRINPRTPDGLGSGLYVIEGTYKKRFPKITPATYNTLLPYDDEYFDVYCSALDWALTRGQVKQEKAQVYLTLLESMRDSESLNLGDEIVSPSEALVHPFYRI